MRVVVGVDEVGRGCWAGPLVAAAVILRHRIPGLKDSKKLTRTQREMLAPLIKDQAVAYGLGWVTPQQIDALGLTKATTLAMSAAVAALHVPYDEIIIDGTFNYLPDHAQVTTLVRADDRVAAVSAASILAKAARDDYMRQQARRFPLYAFEQHVGYGTARHRELLHLHGLCELHRLSYRPVKEVLINA